MGGVFRRTRKGFRCRIVGFVAVSLACAIMRNWRKLGYGYSHSTVVRGTLWVSLIGLETVN